MLNIKKKTRANLKKKKKTRNKVNIRSFKLVNILLILLRAFGQKDIKKKHKIRQTVNLRVKSRKFHSRRFQKKGEEKGYEGHRSGLCK